jgi:hypothetical protein
MAREFEKAVLKLVTQIVGGTIQEQAEYERLARLGSIECGSHWSCVREIYYELTSKALPEPMPPPRKRRVDAVLQLASAAPRIVEVDEKQHFNCYRAATFRFYPSAIQLAFDRDAWIERSRAKTRFEGGKFDVPRPLCSIFRTGAIWKERFVMQSAIFSRPTMASCQP